MAKVLNSDHAEDVGGAIVEPGDAIPRDADPEIVKQLEADGKVVDSSKKSEKEEGD